MRGIIFCAEYSKGLERFERLVQDYSRIGIEPVCIRKSKSFQTAVEFTNGDYWQVVKATDRARGYCCNVAYIDENIQKEIVDMVIMRTIKAFPYQAHRYY